MSAQSIYVNEEYLQIIITSQNELYVLIYTNRAEISN